MRHGIIKCINSSSIHGKEIMLISKYFLWNGGSSQECHAAIICPFSAQSCAYLHKPSGIHIQSKTAPWLISIFSTCFFTWWWRLSYADFQHSKYSNYGLDTSWDSLVQLFPNMCTCLWHFMSSIVINDTKIKRTKSISLLMTIDGVFCTLVIN